ncbi:peptide ABC transporter substrate-binding protein [Brachybacterium sp. AOP43-C2-M15]|uniref:peptide ABC transporter substrate-binding protein n=1 Tax=Brachybacterium sp. AOP43-C2-M15 TaxID=3457661 RepID=UPI004033BB2D
MAFSRRSLMLGTAAGGTALTLAACGGGDGGESGEDGGAGGDAILMYGAEPQNPLHPTNTNEVNGGRILQNLFSGLISYAADGSAVNEVAESIETEDSQHYTVTLAEGWTFHNGDPVTAQSFVDAWNYGANGANGQYASSFFETVEGYADISGADADPEATLTGLEVTGDLSFTIALTSPQSDFPIRLGYTAFSPLPQAFFDDPEGFGEEPIGNGPYRLVAWSHNQNCELEANPDYPGPRKPANSGLDFIFYQDQETAYNDLLSGGVDVIDYMAPSALGSFEDELGERAINQPAAGDWTFTIHMDDPDFTGEAGRLRRQAISMAIDRQQISDAIYAGTREPATDFTTPSVNGFSDDIPGGEVLTFDEERAKELWAEAEEMEPFTGPFTLAYNADGGHQDWVDAVCNSLRNVLGIEASGNSYPDLKSLRDEVTARTITGAFRTGWQADYPSMYNFLTALFSSAAAEGRGSNDGDYMNPEFDDLLQQGLSTTDEEESYSLARQAQELLMHDLPAIPLWFDNAAGGYAETVENVEFAWDGQPVWHQITKV